MPSTSQSSPWSSSTSFFSDTRDGDSERKRKFWGTTKTTSRTQQPSPSNPAMLRFAFSDFVRLNHPKGRFVESHPIRILNKSWNLRVYPRGHGLSRADKTLVSCFLIVSDETHMNRQDDDSSSLIPPSQSKTRLLHQDDDFEFSFRIRDWRMLPKRCGFRTDVAYGFMGHSRESILQKGLETDGSLVVDVALKFWPKSPQQSLLSNSTKKRKLNTANTPYSMNSDLASQLFRSHEFTDLSFKVGQTIFQAHKCVLSLRARTLVELALGDNETDEATADYPIAIPGVEEEVFRAFLEYAYTSNQDHLRAFLRRSSKENLWPAVPLLEVADKFGAVDLKANVESVLANELLSPANCCEMLLLADSHWCSVLKKKALDLFCSDPQASINASPGWDLLKKSPKLLSEILLRSAKTKGMNRRS